MFLATEIFKNSNSLCLVVVDDDAAAAVDLQKKLSLWHSRGAWMKKITSLFYNTLKRHELKYNAIASLL